MATINKIGERIADLFGESTLRSIIWITFLLFKSRLWSEIPAAWFSHGALNSHPFTCQHLFPPPRPSNTSLLFPIHFFSGAPLKCHQSAAVNCRGSHTRFLVFYKTGVAGNSWWRNYWQVNRSVHFFWLYTFPNCFLLNLWLSKRLFGLRENVIRSILTDFLVLALALPLVWNCRRWKRWIVVLSCTSCGFLRLSGQYSVENDLSTGYLFTPKDRQS